MGFPLNAGFPDVYPGPGQIKIGSLLGQIQWREWEFDPLRGVIYRGAVEFPLSQVGEQQWQDFINSGIATKIRYANGKAIVDFDDSTQTYILDSWSMGSNDEQLSVWLNPIIVADLNANVAGGSAYAVPYLQQAIQSGETAEDAIINNIAVPDNPWENYPENGYTLLVYPDIQAGVTDFKNAQSGEGYTLRHKTNFPNTTQLNVADMHVGQIYTTAQLLSEISNAALWDNPCPEYLQYKVANVIAPPYDDTRTIGWFKDRSVVDPAANNRVDVSQEYTYGQWSISLYYPYH